MTTKKSSIINQPITTSFLTGTSSIGILDATNTTLVRRQRVLETCFAAAQEADLSDEVGLFSREIPRVFCWCVFLFVGLASCQVGWLVVGFCFCCISVVFLVLLLVGLG